MAKAKEIDGLDCEADAIFNIELILRTRFEEMCAFQAQALDWSDIKGVHDMRVASRRLRSALSDFAPYIGEGKAPRKRVREIARALGSVRDEDVAILALEKLLEKAKEEVASLINPLIKERRRRQAQAREQLTGSISDEALGQLQEKFAAWLRNMVIRAKNSKDVSHRSLTFKGMGRELILSRYGELDNLSASLFRPFDVEPLHVMRIAAKRLRYSLELFDACFCDRLEGFTKEAADLQASLGELHDCDVWIEDLGAGLKARGVDNSVLNNSRASHRHAAEDNAAIWLLQHFVKERTKHYSDALKCWSEWKAKGFRSKLDENLRAGSSPL